MEKFQPPNLMSIRMFLETNPAFTNGSLRKWLSLAAVNGMNEIGVIRKLYGKIYIDVERFYEWFMNETDKNREIVSRI
ncbi:MAG: hypothetical protein ACTSXL_00015 [Alphaproteobacteria bacterium]